VVRRFPKLTAWVFSLAYLAIAGREHFAGGGPALGRTIASRSSTSPKNAEDTLLLYEVASKTLPRGASITAFKPNNRGDDKQVLRWSLGQLPYHRVVPQSTLDGRSAPDFVITLGAPISDARYELVTANAAGAIWKRTRW
jgi:hypothetical protein